MASGTPNMATVTTQLTVDPMTRQVIFAPALRQDGYSAGFIVDRTSKLRKRAEPIQTFGRLYRPLALGHGRAIETGLNPAQKLPGSGRACVEALEVTVSGLGDFRNLSRMGIAIRELFL